MKKNVIALAVAAAMAAPLAAQAEVSISGGLQAEVVNYGGDGGIRNGLYAADGGQVGSENGGSYGFLKFSASEDLGGGMKALAMWNSAVNVGDTGGSNGGMGGRDAYVGLTGGFGTVLAGTLATPYKSSTVSWDPFVATSLQARGNGGMSDAQNGYANNALAYANKFGPATVVLALVVDEGNDPADATKTNGEHAKSISVNAPVGPVEVAFAYVDGSKFSSITDLGLKGTASVLGDVLEKLTATKIGVKWTSGPITVAGQYEALDIDDTAADSLLGGLVAVNTAAGAFKPTNMYLTASYAMGANTVSLGYGKTAWDISGVDDTTYTAIGLKHAFSKSTSAHVGYRSTDAGNFGDKDTVTSVGLRVGF